MQPHRADTFKLSPDPLLIEKVRDIAGLYMNPPDHALVLCIDEKSQNLISRSDPYEGLGIFVVRFDKLANRRFQFPDAAEFHGAMASVELTDDAAGLQIQCGKQ